MAEVLKEVGGKVRLHVPLPLGAGAAIRLEGPQAHYLLHVMRAGAGACVALFNGQDGEWLAEITDVGKRALTLTCQEKIGEQTVCPDVWLVFAPIKKTPSDYLVQKATELGVRVLQPVFTRRTIVSRVNRERMVANAVEAAEQTGRRNVPQVCEPVAFDHWLAQWPRDRRLYFCDEAGAATTAGEVRPLAEAAKEHSGPAAILTGPEGGFDPGERAALRAHSFVVPVGLGPRILRADTAALAALAIWQSVAGGFHQPGKFEP